MTRQAALPDDSLPHWREHRLEGRASRNSLRASTAEALAQIGLFAEELWKPLRRFNGKGTRQAGHLE